VSQPDLINGLYEEKPRSSIYTAMLGIALVSLIIAAYLLYLEMDVYKFDFKAAEAKKVTVPLKAEYPEAPAPEATATEGETPPEGDPAATPSATPSATADPTATATPSPTATPAATPSATAAPAGTALPAGTAPVPAASGTAQAAPAATGTAPAVPAPSATAAPSATGT